MYWDTHLHTHFSGDSSAEPRDMLQAAVSAGLDGVCFTDHLDLDYPKEPELFQIDLDRYFDELAGYKRVAPEGFGVRFGLELGLQPHLAWEHFRLLSCYPFDFIIGSSHVVHGIDPYYPEYYDGRTEREAYLEYFASILENISAFDGFDVYGHIDYVVRYGPDKNRFYTYEAYAEAIDAVLKALIEKGKGIELNTGGFRYGLGHPNPTEAVLKRYRQLGGEIVTLGSDAHEPKDVASYFPEAALLLKDAGFSYYTVFSDRKPVFIKLP